VLSLLPACSNKGKETLKPNGKPDAGETTAQTWTSQAGDVQSTWHNTTEAKLTTKTAPTLVHLWEAPMANESTVSVVGDKIYVAAANGISMLDADTGTAIWTQSGTPEEAIGATSSPTYDDGVLYINNGSGGWVYALDAEDGSVKWRVKVEMHPSTAGYSTPIIYEDRIYIGLSSSEEATLPPGMNATFRGSVIALDKATGALQWQTFTAGPAETGCAVWSTVALAPEDGLVYAATGNNYTGSAGPGSDSIFALDMKTGDVRWHTQVTTGDVFTIRTPASPDSDFGANPVVFDYQGRKLLAAGQKSGDIYVFDRLTGDIIQKRHTGGGSAFIGGYFQALGWDGEHIVGINNQTTSTGPHSEDKNGDSSSTGVLFVLDPLTLDIVLETQLPANSWSPLTISNGVAYVGAETHLEAIDLSDGSRLFDYKAVGSIIGGPVINKGRIYVPSGLQYFQGHADDKLHAFALPDDPAIGKQGSGSTGAEPLKPTFTNVYRSVIAKSCIQSQCHGASKLGNLGMSNQKDAYDNLVGVTASGNCEPAMPGGTPTPGCGCAGTGKTRVVPSNAGDSLLIQKLGGSPSCGDRMPNTGEPLPDAQQQLVKDWIAAGANND
jgi:polyvinyl alcohol dehydrogenase (cytochrome)